MPNHPFTKTNSTAPQQHIRTGDITLQQDKEKPVKTHWTQQLNHLAQTAFYTTMAATVLYLGYEYKTDPKHSLVARATRPDTTIIYNDNITDIQNILPEPLPSPAQERVIGTLDSLLHSAPPLLDTEIQADTVQQQKMEADIYMDDLLDRYFTAQPFPSPWKLTRR